MAVLLTLAAGLFSGFRIQTPSRSWMRPALVTMQIALATCLIYATGLLGESLWKMQNVPLGIATDHLLSARVDLLAKESGKRDEIWNALKERVSVLPGIESQTLSDSLPPSQRSSSMIYSRISADGKPEDLRGGTGGMVCIRFIAPSYFQTLRISMLKGRTFNERETDAIIVSASLARRLFDGAIDVVGRSVRPGTGETWRTIVGVVADVNNNGIETGDPEYYLPLASESGPNHLYLTARTGGDPQLIADLIRAEVHALDPHVPLTFETMEQRSSKLTERSRFNAAILTFFAIAGLLIGTLGVYGVVCFLISQRRKEVAVRMAVGATRTQIRNLILGTAIRWTVAGMVASAALMAAALPLVRHLLFETPPARPLLMLVAIVVMTGAVLCASLGPANRAANSDPMPILKQD